MRKMDTALLMQGYISLLHGTAGWTANKVNAMALTLFAFFCVKGVLFYFFLVIFLLFS